VIEFPGDTHRPAPLVGEVPGGSKEGVGLRDAVEFVVLANEEEDPVAVAFVLDVAFTGR